MKFSITIPAFKRAYLKEAIDSCLAQSYQNFELIIVNDASPEELDSIVTNYTDKRIRYFKNKKNCGAVNVVDNWNRCLEYATGDYIICMGDDDCLRPHCLEEYAKLITLHPGLGVYHAWTEIIDENSDVRELQSPRPEWESCLSLLWNRWNERNLQFIGDFCFSVTVLKKIGGFVKLPLAWASDDITAVKCAEQGGIANTQTICFQYRINPYTISSVGKTNYKLEAVNLEREWYTSFIKEYEEIMDDSVPVEFINVEKKYLGLIKKHIDQHAIEKQKRLLKTDMANKLWKFFYWGGRLKKYRISKKTLIASFVYGIIEKYR